LAPILGHRLYLKLMEPLQEGQIWCTGSYEQELRPSAEIFP